MGNFHYVMGLNMFDTHTHQDVINAIGRCNTALQGHLARVRTYQQSSDQRVLFQDDREAVDGIMRDITTLENLFRKISVQSAPPPIDTQNEFTKAVDTTTQTVKIFTDCFYQAKKDNPKFAAFCDSPAAAEPPPRKPLSTEENIIKPDGIGASIVGFFKRFGNQPTTYVQDPENPTVELLRTIYEKHSFGSRKIDDIFNTTDPEEVIKKLQRRVRDKTSDGKLTYFGASYKTLVIFRRFRELRIDDTDATKNLPKPPNPTSGGPY